MRHLFATRTHWFSLSRKELLTLAAGVVIVVAAINVGRGVERLLGRTEAAVVRPGDVLPPPAKVDVNAAADYELTMLPRVGPKTAQAIAEYRREHGPFVSLDDLANVRGIGPVTLEAIRPYAVCGPGEGSAGDAQN